MTGMANLRFRMVLLIVVLLAAMTHVWAQGLQAEERWRQAYSMYSGVTNPTFINEENYMALRFLFANTLQMFYMHEAGFTMPLGLYNAAGISWIMHGANNIEATDEKGDPIPGKTFSAQDHYFTLSYAQNVWNRLTVGGSLNVSTKNIPVMESGVFDATDTRLGIGVDVGLTWKLPRHQMLGNHILGLSTTNIFTLVLDDTEEVPSQALRFSLLSDFWERRISYGADFVLKDLFVDASNYAPGFVPSMPWELNQRIGCNILRIFKLHMLIGLKSDEGFAHYGFAFGVNLPPRFSNGRSIEGMMQFVSVQGNMSGDANHITFYARTELGRHRIDRHAKKSE